MIPASAAAAQPACSSANPAVAVEQLAARSSPSSPASAGRGRQQLGSPTSSPLREVRGEQPFLERGLGARGVAAQRRIRDRRWASRVLARRARSRRKSSPSPAASEVTWSMIAAACSGPPNLRAYASATGIDVPGGAFGSSWNGRNTTSTATSNDSVVGELSRGPARTAACRCSTTGRRRPTTPRRSRVHPTDGTVRRNRPDRVGSYGQNGSDVLECGGGRVPARLVLVHRRGGLLHLRLSLLEAAAGQCQCSLGGGHGVAGAGGLRFHLAQPPT